MGVGISLLNAEVGGIGHGGLIIGGLGNHDEVVPAIAADGVRHVHPVDHAVDKDESVAELVLLQEFGVVLVAVLDSFDNLFH